MIPIPFWHARQIPGVAVIAAGGWIKKSQITGRIEVGDDKITIDKVMGPDKRVPSNLEQENDS
jgi:hypothetical protein